MGVLMVEEEKEEEEEEEEGFFCQEPMQDTKSFKVVVVVTGQW